MPQSMQRGNPANDNPDPFAWAKGREHLKPRHARFLGELLCVAAAHAPDRKAQTDLRIASAAAFDAANRLQQLEAAQSPDYMSEGVA